MVYKINGFERQGEENKKKRRRVTLGLIPPEVGRERKGGRQSTQRGLTGRMDWGGGLRNVWSRRKRRRGRRRNRRRLKRKTAAVRSSKQDKTKAFE